MPTDSRLADLDDGALARRVAEGRGRPDSAAEAELYRRLAPRARLYGLRHLRDRQAAADLAQQVLLMTLERLRAGEVREPERIASFVLGACRMTVLEMRRGERRRGELLELHADKEEAFEAPGPLALDPDRLAACLEALSERERSVVVMSFFADKEEAFEAPEPLALDPDRLGGCLEALSERERSVVVMSFFADKAADEVGAELGLSGGNVRVIRHRALGRLRDCMGADG